MTATESTAAAPYTQGVTENTQQHQYHHHQIGYGYVKKGGVEEAKQLPGYLYREDDLSLFDDAPPSYDEITKAAVV